MTPMGVIFRSAFTVMNRGRACSPVLPTERIAYLTRAVRLLRCGISNQLMSQKGQCTKSLRSSPLRGSKSREAGSRSRGQGWRGGKVNTISSRIVGVQRMIKNSKDHLAGRHPDAASHIDPPQSFSCCGQ
jgi:hypothetical protein